MLQTKHLSIMFTDMKGFTTKAATQSRQQLQHLLELQDEIIKPAIKHFDGNIIKTIGDAFLVTFESPTDAVLCGMKIQENILNHNARATSSDQMEVRIAINSGEVNIKDGDVFGEPVNIASRIESIAEPNEVYFTEAVYLTMNKNEIPTAEVGHRKLKGIPEEIKVYKVMSEQTNLIRAKLKREQMAMANANLAKDQENITKPIPVPLTTPASQENRQGDQKNAQPKKSFWQKHKKKIIIALFILLFLIAVGNANERKKKEQELNTLQSQKVLENWSEFKTNFNKAIENDDQAKINEVMDHLRLVTQNPPAKYAPQIISFIETQLKNPDLTPKQTEELKAMLIKLKKQ
ncbi:adenylate/guanylate cyclase domain-containing protein [Candidatus Falkowbacteria bacterium]|nr:adenylate/guanylate cyclase domain-containing protein [Candidatus Falkowbacteria bacterium]